MSEKGDKAPEVFDSYKSQQKGSVPAGLGLGCLFQIGVLLLIFLISLGLNGKGPLEFIGLFQLLPFIPAVLHFSRRKQTRTVQGLVIQAGIGFLLGSICGVLLSGLGNMR
jgi:hypothetical protein